MLSIMLHWSCLMCLACTQWTCIQNVIESMFPHLHEDERTRANVTVIDIWSAAGTSSLHNAAMD